MNQPKFLTHGSRHRARHAAQRGVSLLFALLGLAAMLLAAVALVRSVDSGALVLGNLAFKQEATQVADRATEAARAWILSGVNLDNDNEGNGYYASSQDNLDPTGRLTSATNKLAVIDWGDSDSCACVDANTCSSCTRRPATCPAALCGDKVSARYVIARLCPLTGAVSGVNVCAKPPSIGLSEAAYSGEIKQGTTPPKAPAASPPYFRIIVRTVGARGAISFTETVVH